MGEEFDVIIIGSGLGGLVCANILAREDMKVLVLEKNQQFGGNLQTFSRDKTIFDTGVHYIGGLLPGQNLHKYFHYLGIADKLKLKRMDQNGFDCVTFDGDPNEYPYAQGKENFIKQLTHFFPDEEDAVRRYIEKMRKICESFPLYKVESNDNPVSNEELMSLKASKIINSLTQNPKLRAVLAGTNFLYAGIENKTPFYVHSLSINSYIESAWRCIGGGSQISKLLIREIRAKGGKVLKHKKVTEISVGENNEIDFISTADGDTYYGKRFISNIDPKKTLQLIKNRPVKKSYLKRIHDSEDTISSFSLYIVLKPQCFPYLNCNYYHFKNDGNVWINPNYDVKNWPESYMISMNAKTGNDKFADGLSVLTYMRYDETETWKSTQNTVSEKEERGESYEKFKQEKSEILIRELEKKFPGIRDCIQSTYVATPLTYRDYIGSSTGCLYGFVKDADFPLKNYLPPKTKINNLFLTGQSISMHGILGVTIGGILTCSELIGRKYLIDKINDYYKNSQL